jgi:predicted MPP superfamily phosphohydrolase
MEHFIRPKAIVWLLIAAILLGSAGVALDNRLQITSYELYDSRVPQAFDGCVIAQLSDLHCQVFGKNQSALLDAVKSGNPDYIMLTGDIIDAYIRGYDSVEALFAGHCRDRSGLRRFRKP